MVTHLNYLLHLRDDGNMTITGTVCGREHSQSVDGTNSTADHAEVTCKLCLRIIQDPKCWRYRKYVNPPRA